MAKDNDVIYTEYVKAFGEKKHENIFSDDDEQYRVLRQSIIDAKREVYNKKSLPFEGVKLYSYEDFKRNEIVNEAEKEGFRIFYIRKYKGENLVTYAAGYFNFRISKFVVLNGSFFSRHDYFAYLNSYLHINEKYRILQNYRIDNNTMTQLRRWTFDSASLAASYFLGKKSTFREWKDCRGKTLDAYYQKYKSSAIDEIEDRTFPDYAEKTVLAENSVAEVSNNAKQSNDPIGEKDKQKESESIHHIFFINSSSSIQARGYFDEEDNRFVILKGSYFSKVAELDFEITKLVLSRQRFIEASCEDWRSYYRVKKDTRCKSATAAASYLFGKLTSYTEWKDEDGNTISEIYDIKNAIEI